VTIERGTVLVVDDDKMLLQALSQWLSLSGFRITAVRSVDEALATLESAAFDAVLSDMRMPGLGGMDLLKSICARWPETPVVLLTGHADVALAVEALKEGAFDFLTKPHDPERLVATLRNACEQHRLRRRIRTLSQDEEVRDPVASRLIGRSPAMRQVQEMVRAVAEMPLDVLISGETGTGKEVVARILHECSARRGKPFVAINCAAVPLEIFESELFGHEAGAFTGARQLRIGKLEHANGGTLFLDEVESMPESAQAKLLRVVQERSIERVGSNRSIAIDLRLITAAKGNLRAAATKGAFRDDLYYRLAGFELALPPLRDRGEDVLHLFQLFAVKAAARVGKEMPVLSPVLAQWLLDQPWPGNVRELKSVAERFAMGFGTGMDGAPVATGEGVGNPISLEVQVAAHERRLIMAALEDVGWSESEAAERLGLPRRTLNEKIRRLGIVKWARASSGSSVEE
jgi:two-component system C4-dicarboxylate transport response regulator DctD